MKTRDNVEVTVEINVRAAKSYCESLTLTKASKSAAGSLDTKAISALIKSLLAEAKAQALEGLDAVIAKDDAEEAAEEKSAP